MQPPKFAAHDTYGRRTIPGMGPLMVERRLRRITKGRKTFFHRIKNGVYDPITYFHVLDAILELQPGELWKTTDLVEFLNATRTHLIWDPTTVGRVVNDIADSLFEANRHRAISSARRWNGTHYFVTDRLEERTAMVNLLEDLYILCENLREDQGRGILAKRVESPMLQCPSILLPLQ